MNVARWVGLAILVTGIGLVLYGFHGKQQMADARADINSSTRFIPDNPVKDIVKGELNKKVDRYKQPVSLRFWGGGILIVVGGALLCFGVKVKPSKKR